MRARPLGFRSDGLQLRGELLLPEQPRALLVLCHGIPSGRPPDPSDEGYAGLAARLAEHGFGSFRFDFRGCREAPGDLSMAAWCRDLEAAIDVLRSRAEVTSVPIVLVASSAGGAVALTVAAHRPDVAAVATLAAVAVWDDLVEPDGFLHECRNLGLIRDPAFPADVAAWTAELGQVAGERHAAGVAPRPLLLIHGDADDVVPLDHGVRIFEAAGGPKELVILPGGAHQLRRDPRAIEALVEWLDRFLPSGSHASVPQVERAP